MTDSIEHDILVYLRHLDAKMDQIMVLMQENREQLTAIKEGAANARRDWLVETEAAAIVSARLDRLEERVERIERRLGLIDAALH